MDNTAARPYTGVAHEEDRKRIPRGTYPDSRTESRAYWRSRPRAERVEAARKLTLKLFDRLRLAERSASLLRDAEQDDFDRVIGAVGRPRDLDDARELEDGDTS